MLMFNAGSENKGGTLEQATINAQGWLESIHKDGFLEVEMTYVGKNDDGDFLFDFTHPVTKKTVQLSTHGFTQEERKRFTFMPRVYWNGSSTADPQISDWTAEGFKHKVVYYEHN